MNQIKLKNVGKRFNRNFLFNEINTEINSGDILIIKGVNGSGKSTLLKIIAGLIKPSTGSIEFYTENQLQKQVQLSNRIGFVAPYYNLFNQLTAYENVEIFNRSLKNKYDKKSIIKLFAEFQLLKKENVAVSQFSSGMKQRLRFLTALLAKPSFLLLDEPTTNLDLNGKELVKSIINEQKKRGPIIICTNDEVEAQWGKSHIEL